MNKTTIVWIVLTLAVASAGGVYLYRQVTHTEVKNTSESVRQPATPVATPSGDNDLNRKRKEGIGSVRDLKPVDLPPTGKK